MITQEQWNNLKPGDKLIKVGNDVWGGCGFTVAKSGSIMTIISIDFTYPEVWYKMSNSIACKDDYFCKGHPTCFNLNQYSLSEPILSKSFNRLTFL
jgi:hypothetical protein